MGQKENDLTINKSQSMKWGMIYFIEPSWLFHRAKAEVCGSWNPPIFASLPEAALIVPSISTK